MKLALRVSMGVVLGGGWRRKIMLMRIAIGVYAFLKLLVEVITLLLFFVLLLCCGYVGFNFCLA